MQNNAFIEFIVQQHALRFGDFTLKSGRHSPYFFNAGVFNDGESLARLGQFYAQLIDAQQIEFDVLFGPAYKGIPLASSTTIALQQQHGRHTPFAFNRKETKDHGEGGQLVGSDIRGKRILLIDDVITAGSALREVQPLLHAEGATLVGAVVALDRQERGHGQQSTIAELKQHYKIAIHSIIRFADILEYLQDHSEYAQHLPAMQAYRQQYGIE